MALSATERTSLETLETDARNLAQLIKGAGSTNQLNRLLVLAQEQNRKLTVRIVELETEMATVLEKVRKLQ